MRFHKPHNQPVETNRRPDSPLNATPQFGRATCAPPSLSAAAAHLDRSAARHMRSILFHILLLGSVFAMNAADTNEFILMKHQGRRQAYEWPITQARILASPEWDAATAKIPLSPDRAWKIARDWFKEQGVSAPDLIAITIRPFVVQGTSFRPTTLEKRFFYRIDCVPAALDSMVVIILLDGTVVEPRRIKDLQTDEIK